MHDARSKSTEEIDPKLLETLSRTLFVMWGFPELSQTFIEREFNEMEALGGQVNVLAAYKVEEVKKDETLQAIVERAFYMGHPAKIVFRGLGYMARHPRRFFKTLCEMVSMPHRTLLFRFRTVGVVFGAASVAEKIAPRRYRHIQAHFAGYHAELAMALSMLLGIPYGITAHATGIWKDRNILFEKIAGAKLVSTCTCHNWHHLVELAGPHKEKVRLVHHGLPLSKLPVPQPLPKGYPVRFLAIGRMVRKKGFEYLVEAARLLKHQNIPFAVTLIGEGPLLPKLEEMVALFNLSDRVQFLGKMSNDAVLERIMNSHCLVVPSVQAANGNMDGIPNVILEAMALARPVIGSALSGIPEVVHHEETGLVIPPGDPDALADAMKRVVRDRGLQVRLGDSGKRFVTKHFDVAENVKKQLALLHDAI